MPKPSPLEKLILKSRRSLRRALIDLETITPPEMERLDAFRRCEAERMLRLYRQADAYAGKALKEVRSLLVTSPVDAWAVTVAYFEALAAGFKTPKQAALPVN